MIHAQEGQNMPDNNPVFISFVEDHILDTEIYDLKQI